MAPKIVWGGVDLHSRLGLFLGLQLLAINTVEPLTLETEIIGLIIEMATFQGLIYTHVYVKWDVAVIERWP